MKKLLVLVCFSLSALVGYSQESEISLSAGYLVNINSDNLQSGSGNSWRVIGSFQETLKNQKWAVGVSTGVMQFQYQIGENSEILEYNIQSVPVYATGKYFVGNKDWKGYLKGSAGLNLLLKNDPGNKAGWNTGAGAGVDYHISQKLLINAEYDFIAWQNDFYGVRLFHSFNLGIGYKF